MKINFFNIVCFLSLMLAFSSCKKLIVAAPPLNEILSKDAYKDSAAATAVLSNIYTQFGISGGSIEGYFAPYPSLYADEVLPVNSNQTDNAFYLNNLAPNNSIIASVWSTLYHVIYECNALTQGVSSSSGLSASLVQQLSGEAKFLRAYAYFLLVNTYGGVPLVLTTDVNASALLPRSPTSEIYKQIMADLKEAAMSLKENYVSTEKIRANKWAAQALLAKVNLFNHDWAGAESASGAVINSGMYTPLEPLQNVFLKNSTEAILQIYENYGFTWSGLYFQASSGSLNYELTPFLLHAFDVSDLRRSYWMDTIEVNGSLVWYPSKYKDNGSDMPNDGEYTMCLRIADQYLIRAESLAHQNKIAEALSDVNTVRARAGLQSVKQPLSADSCLRLIMQERQKEMFTEWGNRFFDLKRTGQLTAVLTSEKSHWLAKDSVYPIPQTEINNNPFLKQNPGY